MRAKFYITLGALLTTLSFSAYAALPAITSKFYPSIQTSLQNAKEQEARQKGLIGHNVGPDGRNIQNSGKNATDAQESDNQNLNRNKYSRIDPNDPEAARKEKLTNDAIVGLMGVESTSVLGDKNGNDVFNWKATGPNTGRLGCAEGFSQVMDAHLTSNNPNEWAMKYLGGPVDPNTYKCSPELQVQLTTGVISDNANELVNKYPNYSDQQLRAMIYSKWFTGSYGNAGNSGVNDGYTSAPQYVYKAENFLAKAYKKYANGLPSISSFVN